MKITRKQLRRLIKEEMSLMMMDPMGHHDHHHGSGCGDERKTGKKCSSCVEKKPCGCGGEMGDIRGLEGDMPDLISRMDDEGHDWASGDVIQPSMPVDEFSLSGDEAFGAGYTMGQSERDDMHFDYTGDLTDLTGEEAMQLGYQAGMLGVDGDGHSPDGYDMSIPHPQSYDAVMNFLRSSADLVDASLEEIMEMTGSTCPMSTKMAIADYLMMDIY